MAIIKRKRVLRPSSRAEKSTYKVDTKNVGISDTLYVTITHESDTEFREMYIFDGKDLIDKNSIHFSYNGENIEWLGNLTYSEVNNSELHETNRNKTTRKKESITREKKSFTCPYCGCENNLLEDQIKYRYLNCGLCNNTVENPFYKKTIMDFVKDNFWKIFFTSLFFIAMIAAVIDNGDTSNKFYQGQECVFTTDAVGGINESTSKQLTQYAIDNDQYGVLELNMRGEAYFALAGDECTYIRNKGGGLVQVYLKKKRVEIIVPETCIRPK